MDDGFQILNQRGDRPFSEGARPELTGRTALRARKRRGRRSGAVDADPLLQGRLTRTQRLIEAAVRVWEWKRGLRQ